MGEPSAAGSVPLSRGAVAAQDGNSQLGACSGQGRRRVRDVTGGVAGREAPSIAGPFVVVSTFPPLRDGIARYAHQQVLAARNRGEIVRTVGAPGSEADVVVNSAGGLRPLRLIWPCRGAGRISVHWHDWYYLVGGARSQILASAALWIFFRLYPQTTVICHEVYPLGDGAARGLRALLLAGARWARRWMWRTAPRVLFHSAAERAQSEKAVGLRFAAAQVGYVGHGAHFTRCTAIDQPTARARLGAEPHATVFLCIGFIGRSKGYDRAIRAFGAARATDARLFVVGSVLYDTPEAVAYTAELRAIAGATPRVTLIEEFVADDVFDEWIAACDCVIAPYTQAFSSGVVERARLFGKRVIAAAVGGLPSQVGPDDHVFTTDAELADLIAEVAKCSAPRGGQSRAPAPNASTGTVGGAATRRGDA